MPDRKQVESKIGALKEEQLTTGELRWPFSTRELFRALRVIKNTTSLRIDRPSVKRPPTCVICEGESHELGHVLPHDDGVYELGIDPRWLQEHATVAVCKLHNQEVEWDDDLLDGVLETLRKDVHNS